MKPFFKVYAIFPGCGLDKLLNSNRMATEKDGSFYGQSFTYLPSDEFQYIYDDTGKRFKNPLFPANYIQQLKLAMYGITAPVYDFIIVDGSKDMLFAMDAADILYGVIARDTTVAGHDIDATIGDHKKCALKYYISEDSGDSIPSIIRARIKYKEYLDAVAKDMKDRGIDITGDYIYEDP